MEKQAEVSENQAKESRSVAVSAESQISQEAITSVENFSPKRTIFIAVDGTPASDSAFNWAIENYIRVGADDLVILATVREPILIPGGYGYMDFGQYIVEAEEQSRHRAPALIKYYGQKLMKRFELKRSLDPVKRLGVRGIVMRGDPRDELVRKSTEMNASALIIGSRGQGAFKRAFLGSVSDYVAHNSTIPVICIKYKASDQDETNQKKVLENAFQQEHKAEELAKMAEQLTLISGEVIGEKQSKLNSINEEIQHHLEQIKQLKAQAEELAYQDSKQKLQSGK